MSLPQFIGSSARGHSKPELLHDRLVRVNQLPRFAERAHHRLEAGKRPEG